MRSHHELQGVRRARGGFTLIEILAVILILGILAGLMVVNLADASGATDVSMTRADLARLEGVIDAYEVEHGDFPPSSFQEGEGVANDGTNVGVERLVVALWSKGWEAGGMLEADGLENTDGDRSQQELSDLGRSLFELVDRWGNPIAYIHRRDYESTDRLYTTLDPSTGEELLSAPQPFRNPDTGRWYRHSRYQVISAGPDGEFGTEDDITSFQR